MHKIHIVATLPDGIIIKLIKMTAAFKRSMIPPVQTDRVWGRAQSGPIQPEGWTGPGPRLAVVDWTSLVWTGPNRVVFINFKVVRKTNEVRW